MTECTRCLLDDSFPGVTLDDVGLCNQCSKGVPSSEDAERFYRRLIDQKLPRQGPYDAIVAFSGGKDSVGTLVHLAERGLNLRAVLFDNGFIPESVVDQAERIARRCGAHFEVVSVDLSDEFRASFASRALDPAPCTICMRAVWKAMDQVASRYGTQLVCSGHRYPPGIKALAFEQLRWTLAVPVAAKLDSERLRELRSRVDYVDPGVPGQSSNCMVPRAVELAYEEWYGFNPGVLELSKEVRTGLVSKAEAQEQLKQKSTVLPHAGTLIRLGLGNLLVAPTD